MRILVGTLYAGENEFEACRRSVRAQSGVDVEQVVFENLPKKEAHEALFRAFMDRAGEFDLMVKVDADMVLQNQTFLQEVGDWFRAHTHSDMLQVKVHDWFTDQLVWGMHVYRSGVVWPETREGLFTDRPPVPPERRVNDDGRLAPAALHCADPSPFQAFHYGLHRGLKVMQYERKRKEIGQACAHARNARAVYQHFRRNGDRRLGLAALGGALTLHGRFGVRHMNYTDTFARDFFEREYAAWEARRVDEEVRRLRRRNLAWLPDDWRLPLLWHLRTEDEPWQRPALRRLTGGLTRAAKRSAPADAVRRGRNWLRRAQ